MMSGFEFVFSLFGLLLGLSLAEVLGGFGKAVKLRRRVRIGWLTPLLGVLVMLDLTSFWISAWAARQSLEVNYLTLMVLLIFSSIFYLAAALVIPEDPATCPDFDVHYWANKRLVLGAIFLLNLPNYISHWIPGRYYYESWSLLAIPSLFLLLLLSMIIARGARANLVLLILTVLLYPIPSVLLALKLA